MEEFCFTLLDLTFFLHHHFLIFFLLLFYKALRVVATSGSGGAAGTFGGVVTVQILVEGSFGAVVQRFLQPHISKQLHGDAGQSINRLSIGWCNGCWGRRSRGERLISFIGRSGCNGVVKLRWEFQRVWNGWHGFFNEAAFCLVKGCLVDPHGLDDMMAGHLITMGAHQS